MMFQKLLDSLRDVNPREYEILEDLDNLERRLDVLLSSQQNCLLYHPNNFPSRIRLRIFNTYADQEQKPIDYFIANMSPSSYTLYIKAFELDINNNVIEGAGPGLLSRHFRLILLDTPTGTVLWDRDNSGVHKMVQCNGKGRVYRSNDRMSANMHGFSRTNKGLGNFSGVHPEDGGRDFACSYNGFDELHISRLGNKECIVSLYLFPSQSVPVFSISDALNNFLRHAYGNIIIFNELQQTTLAKIVQVIWLYALKHRLFVECSSKQTYIMLDNVLSILLSGDEGDRINIHDLVRRLQPHLYPPLPIKIDHSVKLSGKPSDNERIVDLTLESSFPSTFGIPEYTSEFDGQISAVEQEIVELLHLRNLYSTFSEDPYTFITSMLKNRNARNKKPLTPDKLRAHDLIKEAWISQAMNNYLSVYDKSIHDLILGILEHPPSGTRSNYHRQ